jgi:hypothetical protein
VVLEKIPPGDTAIPGVPYTIRATLSAAPGPNATVQLYVGPTHFPMDWSNVISPTQYEYYPQTGGNAVGSTDDWIAMVHDPDIDPSNPAATSNTVSVTYVAGEILEGWTVVELKQFAADHEPPIPIPSTANKAEIIAIILAFINAGDEEEDD